MNAVQIRHLNLAFDKKALFVDFNFCLKQGGWTAILGRSGVGKSTLLRVIAGLEQDSIQSGEIVFQQTDKQTQQVAFMAQNDGLFPWLSVIENVQLVQHLQGCKNKASYAQAETLLQAVNMLEYRDKACYQLSGGQRQRVALARTLMQSAEIVLMDEPFSALDVVTRLQLQTLSRQLLANKTVLLITHDPQEALMLCDQIFVLQKQSAQVVLTPPITPTIRSPEQAEFWQLHQHLLRQLQQGE
ncbi:phosphonate ABC transporter ATP-binding protein [Gallibacterium genomosp. 3]|uniref:Phosphonate ABC transporter ATP-binding protein n=1 Tax=Gallibacterium genomosp. 3 TaxID=505345 RepID=A0A1A7PVK1_9PAST|nr:ABC transporter ATP-binding protein [Gallibacterium genomosp. 3]OBX05185.1 phosphonate ABC transporter ATP-binding protein [Gallibacterium genomosp. 3]